MAEFPLAIALPRGGECSMIRLSQLELPLLSLPNVLGSTRYVCVPTVMSTDRPSVVL